MPVIHDIDSQCAQILERMLDGWPITAKLALAWFGCFRLAARIKDLRDDGHDIRTEMIQVPNSYGKTVRVARYSMRAE